LPLTSEVLDPRLESGIDIWRPNSSFDDAPFDIDVYPGFELSVIEIFTPFSRFLLAIDLRTALLTHYFVST
jgi:hypothetical protein